MNCEMWSGAVQRNGYGYSYSGGRKIYAHRNAYEMNNGPIPEGAVIHHSCGERLCVNPNHLSMISDNNSHGALHSGLDHNENVDHRKYCGRGHEFTEENTYIKNTKRGRWRKCRECHRLHMESYIRRNRKGGA